MEALKVKLKDWEISNNFLFDEIAGEKQLLLPAVPLVCRKGQNFLLSRRQPDEPSGSPPFSLHAQLRRGSSASSFVPRRGGTIYFNLNPPPCTHVLITKVCQRAELNCKLQLLALTLVP